MTMLLTKPLPREVEMVEEEEDEEEDGIEKMVYVCVNACCVAALDSAVEMYMTERAENIMESVTGVIMA